MSQIIEFPSFGLKKGISMLDFLNAHEKFHTQFVSKQKGYISHQLLTNGEKYFDLITWNTIEDKNNAFKAIYENDEAINFCSFIEDDSADEEIPIFSVIKSY